MWDACEVFGRFLYPEDEEWALEAAWGWYEEGKSQGYIPADVIIA